jgi:hypothetical protein
VSRHPSPTYELIRKAVRERQQIVFTYNEHPREACPVILGYGRNDEEAVFAYQFAGRTSEGLLPQWRCFHLEKIRGLQFRSGTWFEGASHRQPQTCIRFVDVDANIPDTLNHTRPLPFGSPNLRPPRAMT